MKRTVAYLTGKEQMELRPDELRNLREGEVRIEVETVGICGSDVAYYLKGASGMGKIEFPFVLGHECAGRIVETWGDCRGRSVGERVAVEPGVPCGSCEFCRTGRYNLCEHLSFMGSAVKRQGGEGGMATQIIRPAAFVYPIPEGMTGEQAALVEPVSVAMHAVRRSGIRAGQKAAILGCGPIAGYVLLMLKACGVSSVRMTDVIEERTAFMERLGADRAYLTRGRTEEDMRALLPEQVDVVYDTTCDESALNNSMFWLKKGGILVLLGVPSDKKQIDMNTLFTKELSLVASFRYSNTYPDAIAMISAGEICPEKLVTHRFPFEQAAEALEKAARREGDTMKIMLEMAASSEV